MFIRVANNNQISLEDVDNFKALHISVDDGVDLSSSEDFTNMSEPADEGRYWLDADQVLQISGRSGDEVWCESFWAMLQKVEAYGFADIAKRKVKAHLE